MPRELRNKIELRGTALRWLTLAVLPWLASPGLEAGRPAVRSFLSKEILSRGPVYAFAFSSDHTLLVGSDCLSRYDGIGWQRIEIPRARAFRALAAAPAFDQDGYAHGRVWVGGIDAIGYVESDRRGQCQFFSLRSQWEASGLGLSEGITFVKAQGRTAWFVTPHHVLRWDGERFTALDFPVQDRLLAYSGPGETVWIWEAASGLWRLDGEPRRTLLRSPAQLPPGAVQWLLPSGNAVPHGSAPPALVGTWLQTSEGVYQLTDNGFTRSPALSEALGGAGASSAVATEDGLAVGTARRGVILGDRAGATSRMIARRGGLRDDTVYGLWQSPDHNLWAGLDDGFDRLTGLDVVSVLGTPEGIVVGSPRKVTEAEGQIYAVTTKAIYHAAAAEGDDAHFSPLVPFNPLFTDSVTTAQGLWTGGSGGIWLSRQGGTTPIWPTINPVARVAPLPDGVPGIIYLEDYRLNVLTRASSGAWQSQDTGQRIDDLPVTLLTDARRQVWLSTLSEGIFCFRAAVDPATRAVTLTPQAHYYEGSGLPRGARRPILTAVGSVIAAFTETDILRFSPESGFVAAPELAGWIGVAGASSASLAASTAHAYWMVQRRALGRLSPYSLLRVTSGAAPAGVLSWEPLQLPAVDGSDEVTSIDVTSDASGESVWIGRKQGLLRVAAPRIEPTQLPQRLLMRGVLAGGTRHFDLSPGSAVVLKPHVPSLRFDFSPGQLLELEPVFYQTRLGGVETDWSDIRTQSSAEFTGLAPGTYQFSARRIDQYGQAGPSLSYGFSVGAPWYLRWPAQAGLLLLLAAGAGYFVRRRLRHLQEQTVKLDRLVAERTRELEMSNAAKSEFLDSISHEIRNPLNGIVGLIAMLDESGSGDVRRELGRSLKACAAGLAQVFNEVLNFSRLEAGEVEVQARPFRIVEVIAAIRALFLDAAVQHGSSVQMELPPDFVDGFVGDESKIRTILSNFIGNALKYAPGTPITVAVSATEREGRQAALLIEVTDQGPGVPDDEQELIFKKFARGSQARQSDILGTGIGLATCRALAKELGGSVGIESPASQGRGATFFLRLILPRVDAPSAAEAPRWDAPASARRALVVDDKGYNQLALAGILQRLGYRLELADTGDKALATFVAQPFDAVFLDLDLPGMSGTDLARALRQQPNTAAVIIIGTSGRSSPEAEQRCRDAGMDALVTKPLSAEAIVSALTAAAAARAS